MKPIPNKIKKRWDALREHGDIKRIQHETGINYVTLWKAINKGFASSYTVRKVNNYFKSVEAERTEL